MLKNAHLTTFRFAALGLDVAKAAATALKSYRENSCISRVDLAGLEPDIAKSVYGILSGQNYTGLDAPKEWLRSPVVALVTTTKTSGALFNAQNNTPTDEGKIGKGRPVAKQLTMRE